MNYNDIVQYMTRYSAFYNGEFLQYHQIIGYQMVSKDHLGYHISSTKVRVLWGNGDETDESLPIMGTCNVTFDKEGNYDHIGNFRNDIGPDSHLVGDVLSINHVFYNTGCV